MISENIFVHLKNQEYFEDADVDENATKYGETPNVEKTPEESMGSGQGAKHQAEQNTNPLGKLM